VSKSQAVLTVIDGAGEVESQKTTCPDCLVKDAEKTRLARSFEGSLARQKVELDALRLELAQLRIQVPELGDEHERVMDVLEYWKPRCKPKARIPVNSVRYRKVADRFKDRLEGRDGWTADELKLAVDGALLSPFHCGDNEQGKKYLDAETIFRDASTVMKHIERAEEELDPFWWATRGWDDPENYRLWLRAEIWKLEQREAA
jgi:hypothetical protein